jgi:tripartite-type tricarboxylate transporter receptor subunit TctC
VFTVIPTLNPELPDPIRGYEPISLVTKAPYLLLIHPSLPAKSPRDIIALARAKPGMLNMGVGSGASLTNLAARFFAIGAHINVAIIPYKGTGQTMIDAISGQIQGFFGNVLSVMPHVKSGRLRAIGVSSRERSSVFPGLPTIAESGVPGYDVTTWHGWLAPAGTPRAITNKLSAELARAVRAPDVAKTLAEDGGEPVGSTPDEFRRLIADEVPRWKKIIKDTNLKLE